MKTCECVQIRVDWTERIKYIVILIPSNTLYFKHIAVLHVRAYGNFPFLCFSAPCDIQEALTELNLGVEFAVISCRTIYLYYDLCRSLPV